MAPKNENAGLRIYAEILRRKGLSVLDAQTLTTAEPWYVVLTWDEAEEESFVRWFKRWFMETHGVSARAFDHDRLQLSYGLHRRDLCADPKHTHDETTERNRPGRRGSRSRPRWSRCPGINGPGADRSLNRLNHWARVRSMVKKKRNEKNELRLSGVVIWKRRAQSAEAELAEAKSSVAISDKAGLRCADDLEAVMKRERELRTEFVALRKDLLAEKRELEFWVEQSDGFRDQVVALLRDWAKEHPNAEKAS